MTETRRTTRHVNFDTETFERFRLRSGLSIPRLAEKAGVSEQTVRRASRGCNVFRSYATAISLALGLDDYAQLLARSRELEPADREYGPLGNEWIAEALTPFQQTSSGLLQYRLCQMAHRHVSGRLGRGKWYELLHENDQQREKLRENLIRHPAVCDRIGVHPNVAENLSTSVGLNGGDWWVIDRHVEGKSLDKLLDDKPFPRRRLPGLMRDLATGLEALHRANVVFRELAPARVIIAKSDGRAVLTDFELAKLLEPAPTVSASWPEDPYRAQEVDSGNVDVRADLYSWARILVHAATGDLPDSGKDVVAITDVRLPEAVRRVAAECLAPIPDERPDDIQHILKVIHGWKQ